MVVLTGFLLLVLSSFILPFWGVLAIGDVERSVCPVFQTPSLSPPPSMMCRCRAPRTAPRTSSPSCSERGA